MSPCERACVCVRPRRRRRRFNNWRWQYHPSSPLSWRSGCPPHSHPTPPPPISLQGVWISWRVSDEKGGWGTREGRDFLISCRKVREREGRKWLEYCCDVAPWLDSRLNSEGSTHTHTLHSPHPCVLNILSVYIYTIRSLHLHTGMETKFTDIYDRVVFFFNIGQFFLLV